MSALLSTAELAGQLNSPRLRILDASWHMPPEKRDARAEFEAAHIPGATFFDIDAVSDRQNDYPHMLPSKKQFARQVSELGIANGDRVVVYDSAGLFSAARVWWMFRVFGHDAIHVLDGGLPKWKSEGRPVTHTSNPASADAASDDSVPFRAVLRPELVYSIAQIDANIATPRVTLLDARSPGRFTGSEPEPRAGLKSGHIPGSLNVFFKDCLEAPFNTLKKMDGLALLLKQKNIVSSQPLAVTCGSGVTGCILALALYQLGNPDVAVYDGAWTEWASQP